MNDFFNILIIDDNTELSLSLKDILEENGFNTSIAQDRETAVEVCKVSEFKLSLIDIKLPDANGIDLVGELSVIRPEMEFIIITGFGTIENAVEAVRNKHIVSFEMKPLDLTHILALIRQIQERKLAEINLQRKLQIEKIFSTISARFVGVGDFDQAIYDSLNEIRTYSMARSAFLFMKEPRKKVIGQSYIWTDKGKILLNRLPIAGLTALFEWATVEIEAKKAVFIPNVENLPAALSTQKSQMQEFGVKSLAVLPIMLGGHLSGILGLENIEHPGLWAKEEFNLLITLSNLFSSALHRQSIEQYLIESEEIHNILLDSTREGIVIIDLQGRIAEVSNITLELFKASRPAELTGRRFLEFIPEEVRKNKGVFSMGQIRGGITQNLELTLLRNDNSWFAGEVNISLLRKGFEETNGYLVVIRDISERKKMDKQLIHTERMAGIGVMAAGMAHEINQPLNNISLCLDNLILALNSGMNDKEYLDNKTGKIFGNITRIRNIIDHVRAFSKDHDDYIQTRFDVNESIRNAESMISEQLKHKEINLVPDLDESLPLIVGNTYKFEQVIVNMIINAKDAIEEKETLVSNEYNKVIEITSRRENHHICVEVTDNGIGVEAKNLDKVMLPFYSTKKEGVGTGLGLSISFGIIRDMNGSIEIQSQRMKGTTLKIKIPIKKEASRHIEKESN